MPRFFRPARNSRSQTVAKTEITVTVDDLADDGRGVGRLDNKVVFVRGGLPGESAVARIERSQKRFDEALAVSILEPSEQRATPLCPHYGDCGGCQLQHLNHDAQLRFKEGRLQRLLSELGVQLPLEPTLQSSTWHYRHRTRLAFKTSAKHGLSLGYRRASSHSLVDVRSCPILQTPLEALLDPLRERLSPWWYQLGSGELSLCVDSEGHIGLHISGHKRLPQTQYLAMAAALENLVTMTSAAARGQLVWQCENHKEFKYQIDNNETYINFSPIDFTQINPSVNAQMVQTVLTWLRPQAGDTIADCFCGLGNFSLPLAHRGAAVRAYELDADMLARLQLTADSLQQTLRPELADLFQPAPDLFDGVNKVLLDPPRAGAAALCESLATSPSVGDILYISCDPATLKRDLATLTQAGFAPVKAAVADMFPHSRHLESMILLKNRTAGK